MWLVLCSANDLSALWVAQGLRTLGLHPLEIVTSETLVYNRRFVHSLTASQPRVIIELADGRIIDSASVCGTLNRLQLVPSEHMRGANTTDRNYGEQELYALFLSWLYGLPGPMFNRPTPNGLCGSWRHLSEWVLLAAQSGLSVMPYHQSDMQATYFSKALVYSVSRRIIVINDICFGTAAPASVLQGCVRLAQLSFTSLLGVDFQIISGNWIFTQATPLPDLRLGGKALLNTLFKVLQP